MSSCFTDIPILNEYLYEVHKIVYLLLAVFGFDFYYTAYIHPSPYIDYYLCKYSAL